MNDGGFVYLSVAQRKTRLVGASRNATSPFGISENIKCQAFPLLSLTLPAPRAPREGPGSLPGLTQNMVAEAVLESGALT